MTGGKEIDKEIVTVPNYVVKFGQAKENGKYIWVVLDLRIQSDTAKQLEVRGGAASKFIESELRKLRRATE